MKKLIFLVIIFLSVKLDNLNTAVSPQIILSQYQVAINVIEGQTGPIISEYPIRVLVKSDIPNWSIHYHATPLSNEKGAVISPSQLLIQTPYTRNLESLDVPRMIGKGNNPTGAKPLEIGNITIGFNSTGFEKPGVYEGQIVSPDGGPTIFVKVIIQETIRERERVMEQEVKIGPKIRLAISPDRIDFPVTGAPGEYEAIGSITLSVESKYGFIVKAQATQLIGKYKEIPPSRIFVKLNGNYESLDKSVIILERKEEIHPEKERIVTKMLNFKLKTAMDDPAGEYKGQIIFTCEPQL